MCIPVMFPDLRKHRKARIYATDMLVCVRSASYSHPHHVVRRISICRAEISSLSSAQLLSGSVLPNAEETGIFDEGNCRSRVGGSKVKNGRTLKLTLDELKPDTHPSRSDFGPVISFDVPVSFAPALGCSHRRNSCDLQ
jgi:hypothetical protein